MRIVTKRLRVEVCSFSYKVALHLSYLHVKFDEEIKRKFLWCGASVYVPAFVLETDISSNKTV